MGSLRDRAFRAGAKLERRLEFLRHALRRSLREARPDENFARTMHEENVATPREKRRGSNHEVALVSGHLVRRARALKVHALLVQDDAQARCPSKREEADRGCNGRQ